MVSPWIVAEKVVLDEGGHGVVQDHGVGKGPRPQVVPSAPLELLAGLSPHLGLEVKRP